MDYLSFYKNQLDFGFRKPGSEDYIPITGKSKEVVQQIFKYKVFPSRFQITPASASILLVPNKRKKMEK